MKISILGGGGFLGRRVAARLAADKKLGGKPVTGLTLFDLAAPSPPPGAGFPVTCVAGDLVELPAAAIPADTDIIFHLAAVVSAQAEADYDIGRRVNLRGTDAVIDACRALKKPPRVVFTSSVASFPVARTRSSTTMPARSPPTAMARKRPRPSSFLLMPPGAAFSMPSACACPR